MNDTCIPEHTRPLSAEMFNIRLSIPAIWINDLEKLRRVHHVTRLALLRQYILQSMELDLQKLKEVKQSPGNVISSQSYTEEDRQNWKWGQR